VETHEPGHAHRGLDAGMKAEPGSLIRHNGSGQPGVILRWPHGRHDDPPFDDPSDEWVVVWFDIDGNNRLHDGEQQLECAGEFEVVGPHLTSWGRIPPGRTDNHRE
jgi:hypothetical protein